MDFKKKWNSLSPKQKMGVELAVGLIPVGRAAQVLYKGARVARKAPRMVKAARTYLDDKYDIQDAAIMAAHKAKRLVKRK